MKRRGRALRRRYGRAEGSTYTSSDMARMLDGLHSRYRADIKGIKVELKRTAKRGKYDHWDLLIDGAKVWETEAAGYPNFHSIDAFVRHALHNAGFQPQAS